VDADVLTVKCGWILSTHPHFISAHLAVSSSGWFAFTPPSTKVVLWWCGALSLTCVRLEMLATAVAVMRMANATRTQRLLAGLGVLLLVDIIWVASSEITKVLMF